MPLLARLQFFFFLFLTVKHKSHSIDSINLLQTRLEELSLVTGITDHLIRQTGIDLVFKVNNVLVDVSIWID